MTELAATADTGGASVHRTTRRAGRAFGGSGSWWLLAPPIAFMVLLLLVPVGLLVQLAVVNAGL
jgi:ABC-type sugar transport system permease subunit